MEVLSQGEGEFKSSRAWCKAELSTSSALTTLLLRPATAQDFVLAHLF